jgi:type II secretory pathway pseudopilin PulG
VASLVLGVLSLAGCIFLAGIPAIILGLLARRDIRRSDGRLSGNGLAVAGLILGVLGSLWSVAMIGVAIPNFREAQTRAKISRVRSDMRSLATAIEAYFVDHNSYPAWVMGQSNGMVSYNAGYAAPPASELPCFVVSAPTGGKSLQMLSTPIAYVVTFPQDPFVPGGHGTFVYWSINGSKTDPSGQVRAGPTIAGWILISPGPDGDYDIPPDYDVYDPNVAQPSARLLGGANSQGSACTYDPTNGTVSDGDIWRVRQ